MATFLSQLFAQMATGQRQFIYWGKLTCNLAESRRVSTYSSKSGCMSKCIKSGRSHQNIVAKRNPLVFSHVILPVCHHRLPPAAATPDTAVDFNLTANSHHDIGVQAKTATKDHKSRTPNQHWFKGTSRQCALPFTIRKTCTRFASKSLAAETLTKMMPCKQRHKCQSQQRQEC